MNIEQELGSKLKSGVKINEPMSNHTSWQVGGPADYYVCPADQSELIEIVRFSRKHELPLFILGNGTNLLVLDGGIRGMVVNIGEAFSNITRYDNSLVAGSGTSMTILANVAAEQGLVGLEFAVGIPGSLGGAVIMNAGAFGLHIGDKIHSVKLITMEGLEVTRGIDDLSFGYRTSNLIGKGIITEVTLKLKEGDSAESLKLMDYYLKERSRRHPNLPSAGSVFRNLTGQPAGKIIEDLGCKGMRVGGAQVSPKHANFIVNTGDATAADILALIETVQKMVKDNQDIDLQPEVKIVGEES
ncbi:MAG: UDP-N-acetylmuramate dehydrogenase [Bacillota bacterium]